MVTSSSDETIRRMVGEIVHAVDPEQVILFGSRATGTARAGSDFDFLIIEKDPFGKGRSRRKEAARIWRALIPFDLSKDILVYSREDSELYRNEPAHVIGQAFKYGKVLYEKER
jgi:predicted nucleotidyltransferase